MKTKIQLIAVILLIAWVAPTSWADPVTMGEARLAAENWPVYTGLAQEARKVSNIFPAPGVGADIAWIVRFEGNGWAIAARDDILLPIYAYSPSEAFPEEQNPAIDELTNIMSRKLQVRKSLDPATRANVMAETERIWIDVLSGAGPKQPPDILGPLGTSDWYQMHAYNEQCPMQPGVCGDATENPDECPTGCVATAMSQIMYIWQHPAGYDWGNMQDQVWIWSPVVQINAVAQLCSDAGISVNMDYCDGGLCRSRATSSDVPNAMANTFGYYDDAIYEIPNTADLVDEIEFLRPIYIRGTGHAWVCDGYDVSGATTLLHWRMGWNGTNDVWATVDDLPVVTGETYENHVRYIAPTNIEFATDHGDCNLGTPTCTYGSLEAAIAGLTDGNTLIIEAGVHYAGSYVISKAMTIRGVNVVIGQ
jgi:hypothetical protein